MIRSSSEVRMHSEFGLLAIDGFGGNNDNTSRRARVAPRTAGSGPSSPPRGSISWGRGARDLGDQRERNASRRTAVEAPPPAMRPLRRGRTDPCGLHCGTSRESPGVEESLRRPTRPEGRSEPGARRPYARHIRTSACRGRGVLRDPKDRSACPCVPARLRRPTVGRLLPSGDQIRGVAPRRMKSPSVTISSQPSAMNSPLTDCPHEFSKSFRNNVRARRAPCAGCRVKDEPQVVGDPRAAPSCGRTAVAT